MWIAQQRDTFIVLDNRAAHEATDRFTKEEIAKHFLRQSISTEYFLPTGGGEMV